MVGVDWGERRGGGKPFETRERGVMARNGDEP
jgi:hypothetical protein